MNARHLLRNNGRGVQPKLACGHWAKSTHPTDPMWDRLTEPVACPECHDDRYLHADLIRVLLEDHDRVVATEVANYMRKLRGED